jgi:hypothetical protein
MPNPFFYGGWITDPARFVGRKAELGRIFAALETAHTGQLQSVSIVGPRRIGKSSLLYHLTQVYVQHLSQPGAYRFAYVDLEDARCSTLAGMLGFVLDQLCVAHSAQVNLAEFQASIEQLSSATGAGIWPVVCLDEFEQLTKNPQEFSDTLYNSWRSLISASLVAFVTASQTPLDRLSRGGWLTSPFFNVFMLVPLGEFTPEEARELVDRGRTCDRPFTNEECEHILKLAGRHPCHLQVACSLLYEAKGTGRAVEWKAVERECKQQVNFQLGTPPAHWKLVMIRVGRALLWLVLSPRYVGRLARFIGFTWDDMWNWIVGVVVLVLIFLLLLRVIAPDMFFKWLGRILGVGP